MSLLGVKRTCLSALHMSAFDPKRTCDWPVVCLYRSPPGRKVLALAYCTKPGPGSGGYMRRREFITLLGGAAVAWSHTARAQQPDRLRRIGVLVASRMEVDDLDTQTRIGAFRQGLQQLGWVDGQNVQIDVRAGGGDADRIRKYAEELVALAPDIILTTGAAGVAPILKATRTVPVVFSGVVDPVGAGFVDSLARPGGNATGFVSFEYGLSAKLLELLKEVAPGVKRVAVIRDPDISAGTGQFAAIQTAAPSFGLDLIAINPREAGEVERAIAAFARTPNGGLITTSSALAVIRRDLIIGLAAKHKLPAIYYRRLFAASGGLVSYGPDVIDQFRRAAGYVDRILKGEKPAELPVQAPNKYELVINLKTAKALGHTIPPSVLARADEVIE
jgi:putative ABC transport system substrate-binding protein